MRPTKKIYDAIIYAFSRCGDTVAAEYYFWEMKRKGMEEALRSVITTPSFLVLSPLNSSYLPSPHLSSSPFTFPPFPSHPLQCCDSGLMVNSHTYSKLMFGFARAQTIGAPAYGTSGGTHCCLPSCVMSCHVTSRCFMS